MRCLKPVNVDGWFQGLNSLRLQQVFPADLLVYRDKLIRNLFNHSYVLTSGVGLFYEACTPALIGIPTLWTVLLSTLQPHQCPL